MFYKNITQSKVKTLIEDLTCTSSLENNFNHIKCLVTMFEIETQRKSQVRRLIDNVTLTYPKNMLDSQTKVN